MIDILLIHPNGSHGIYGVLGDDLVSLEQPLWCRLIAGYLLDHGHTVRILDMEAERATPEDAARIVAEDRPRLVAIVAAGHQPSASTQSMPGARAVAQAIKVACPDVPIALLGNHASALPLRTLHEEPVDFVIDGEGAVSLNCLLKLAWHPDDKPSYHSVPGLYWRDDDGTECASPERAPLLDLNRNLHGNAWHLLPPPSAYRCHNWQTLGQPQEVRSPYAAIYTSLGCPYTCHFCMINIFQHTNKYRMRNPIKVVDEIEMLYREHNVRVFKIIDELFCLNRKHVRAICQDIFDRGIGDQINIWAYARTDTVSPKDLPLMRAGGIRWLALGIESGSAVVRAGAGKALRGDSGANTAIKQTVRAIQAAGINVIGNYIFGLPNDDIEWMRQTLWLAQGLNTEWANFYCAMAYPGSKLYDQAIAEGLELPTSWAGYSQHNKHCRPLDTKYVDSATVLRFRDEAFRVYFSAPQYQQMVRAKFGPAAIEHIEQMLDYNLERDILKC